jgi:hypothetical protein
LAGIRKETADRSTLGMTGRKAQEKPVLQTERLPDQLTGTVTEAVVRPN